MLNQNTIRIACFGQELIIPNQRPLNERDMPKSRRKGKECHRSLPTNPLGKAWPSQSGLPPAIARQSVAESATVRRDKNLGVGFPPPAEDFRLSLSRQLITGHQKGWREIFRHTSSAAVHIIRVCRLRSIQIRPPTPNWPDRSSKATTGHSEP